MQTTSTKPVFVTTPSLAPVEEFASLLTAPWESGILTHNGPLVQRLEKELCEKWGMKQMVAVNNGTIAIQLALKALDLDGGEIITTPFSWVASCSAILWERCTPVFVDIDPLTLNIDPSRIEDAITHRTRAIMGVHVFSNPCDVNAIDSLAKKHNLKVIYDGAHAVYTYYQGKPLLEYGDIAATSFHATKLFNTAEGGACVSLNDYLHERLKRLRFFGHDDRKEVVEDGCNGKMTEVHAALGLANLKYLDQVLAHRRQVFESYYALLCDLDFLRFQSFNPEEYNYSYLPVIFDTEERLLKVEKQLQAVGVYGRRYFYPSLNTMKAVAAYQPMPVSESIAQRILCLPSHNGVDESVVRLVSGVISQG